MAMKKTDVVDIETLEVYYTATRKIKFRDDYGVESLDDIYAGIYPTKLGMRYSAEPTFYNRGGHHCHSNRFRSIEDFIKLSKKYFPDTTVKEIFQFLKEKEDFYLEKNLRQYLGYCPNIRKYNYRGLNPPYYGNLGISDYCLGDLCENLSDLKVSDVLT